MRRTALLFIVLLLFAIAVLPAPVCAGEVDILVSKLVEKGILTAQEADEILAETKEEVKKEIEAGESDTLPLWVQTFKIYGGLRFRYQWEEADLHATGSDPVTDGRERVRIKADLGVKAKVNDTMAVALGICTGGSDPRSRNQTFQDSFSSKELMLNHAFATWTPQEWFTAHAGKIEQKNTMWINGGFLWDGDISPEGVAVNLTHPVNDSVELFANIGWFLIDETDGVAKASEPHMHVIQPGVKWQASDKVSFKGAVNYVGFSGIKGRNEDIEWSSGSNTQENGAYKYDYDSVGTTLQVDIEPSCTFINKITVFGDYINNPDADEDTGYRTGIRIGDDKVNELGKWQLGYQYLYLEQDAWVDFLTETDVLGGDTNTEGHKVSITYGLAKNTSTTLSYYDNKDINVPSGYDEKRDENILQVDLNWKF